MRYPSKCLRTNPYAMKTEKNHHFTSGLLIPTLFLCLLTNALAVVPAVPLTDKLMPGPPGDPGALVAVDGDYALVGTGRYSFGTNSSGRSGVQLHDKTLGANWPVRKSLAPPTSAVDVIGYGMNIAIDGDTAAVASTKYIFIYNRNQGGADQWGLVREIDRSTSEGVGMDLDQDTLAFQAATVTGVGVEVRRRNQGGANQWGYFSRVMDPSTGGGGGGGIVIDPGGGDFFGNRIALSGNIMAVGGGSAAGQPAISLLRDGDGPGGALGTWGVYRTLVKENIIGGAEMLGTAFDWADGQLCVTTLRLVSGNLGSWVHVLTPPAAPTTGAWPQLHAASLTTSGEVPMSFGCEIKTGAGWFVASQLFPNSTIPTTENRRATIYRSSGGPWSLEATVNLGPIPPTFTEGLSGGSGSTPDLTLQWMSQQRRGKATTHSLACDGTTLLAGLSTIAPSLISPDTTVTVRERTLGVGGWSERTTLQASAGSTGKFGQAISIGRSFMAIGEPGDDEGAVDSGAVSIYVRDSGKLTNDWREFGRVKASDATAGANFGAAVATDGNLLVVGAPGKDGGRGAVYIFTRGAAVPDSGVFTWRQRAIIEGMTGRGNSRFGAAVALNRANEIRAASTADPLDQRVIIGAPSDRPSPTADADGMIFIYRPAIAGNYSAWSPDFTSRGSDTATGAQFGSSLAFEGDTLAVGAWLQTGGGAVYVFRDLGVTGWTQTKKLTASDGTRGFFGYGLALSRDRLAIGTAPFIFPNSGGVFIHERFQGGSNNWGEVKKILPIAAQASWGLAVALEEDTVLIGSPIQNDAGSRSGAVFIHRQNEGGSNNWGQVRRLLANDAENDDTFGTALVMNLSAIAIGAPSSDTRGTDTGAVYTYRLGSYEIWAGLENLLPGQEGPYSDPDLDGQINLVEFALGSDPRDLSSIGRFNYQITTDAGQQWLEATWFKPLYSMAEVQVDFRGSSNLTNFGEYLRVTSDNPLVKVGRSFRPVSTQPKYFTRLHVIYPDTIR